MYNNSLLLSPDKKVEFDEIAIKNFQEYLTIPSVHPNVNYEPCIEFLKQQADSLQLDYQIILPKPNKPIFLLTWEGLNPQLPSILLNSHMDVVPVCGEKWSHDPFGGEMDESGRIYGRGAQDMKSNGIQYMEALKRLKACGVRLKRTVHCCFVPDEEIGGMFGMREFVKCREFLDLNVGFALDEGMASANDTFLLFYGERCIWHITFHCPGQPGHGSLLHENTAAEKVRTLLDIIYDYRAKEKQKLIDDPRLTIGDVMTLNVTIMNGGIQANVLPAEFTITIDCRIPVTMQLAAWNATLEEWCVKAGEGVFMEIEKYTHSSPTKLDDSNPYWVAFREFASKKNMKIEPRIFPGGTDSRYLRQIDIPAVGFSPIVNTPVLMHDNDEYLPSSVFLNGIDIYVELLQAISNV